MSDDQTGLYAFPLEPPSPFGELRVGYPDDYRDPPWTTNEEFRDIVIPARMAALKRSFDQALADMGMPGMSFEWQTDGEPHQHIPDDEARQLAEFLASVCPECATPGDQRHLAAVGGCATCAEADPRPVFTPVRDFAPAVEAVLDGAMRTQLEIVLRESSPAYSPLGDRTVKVYDMVLPKWRPYDVQPWTPMRNRIRRAGVCYPLPSGNMVHVKPGCRCPR